MKTYVVYPKLNSGIHNVLETEDGVSRMVELTEDQISRLTGMVEYFEAVQ